MADDRRLAERFRVAVDLSETGVALRRQAIRRSVPEASDEEVERRLIEWLRERPGAENGDGPSGQMP